jgi:hypothetical protein
MHKHFIPVIALSVLVFGCVSPDRSLRISAQEKGYVDFYVSPTSPVGRGQYSIEVEEEGVRKYVKLGRFGRKGQLDLVQRLATTAGEKKFHVRVANSSEPVEVKVSKGMITSVAMSIFSNPGMKRVKKIINREIVSENRSIYVGDVWYRNTYTTEWVPDSTIISYSISFVVSEPRPFQPITEMEYSKTGLQN